MSTPAERFLEENADGYRVERYGAAADALVAAGLLSAERARYWKAEHARAQAAGPAHAGSFDPDVEDRAEELLQALFTAVRPRASESWDPVTYQRYQAALFTLKAIGALSPARARPWLERQQQTLTPSGGWPAPEPQPEMSFTAGDLSAVLAGPHVRLGGMRVMHVELYGDCVFVHFHQILGPEPDDPVERRELLTTAFELHDDRGTAYRPAGIPEPDGCAPAEPRWRELYIGCQPFVPAVPLSARVLTATWREHRFSARVRSD